MNRSVLGKVGRETSVGAGVNVGRKGGSSETGPVRRTNLVNRTEEPTVRNLEVED